jgi:hypothetical protein
MEISRNMTRDEDILAPSIQEAGTEINLKLRSIFDNSVSAQKADDASLGLTRWWRTGR